MAQVSKLVKEVYARRLERQANIEAASAEEKKQAALKRKQEQRRAKKLAKAATLAGLSLDPNSGCLSAPII